MAKPRSKNAKDAGQTDRGNTGGPPGKKQRRKVRRNNQRRSG
jgi:hypothetical protein